MALITRINRLFRADMHAVLDRLEEPDALLKQAIREMEENINDNQAYLKQLQHQSLQMLDQHREFERTLAQIQKEMDVCFDSGNEDLARKLIKRRLETNQYFKLAKRKLEQIEFTINDVQESITENKSRLLTVKQKQELLGEENSADNSDLYIFQDKFQISEDDVEVAFLQEKQQRSST